MEKAQLKTESVITDKAHQVRIIRGRSTEITYRITYPGTQRGTVP